MTYVIPISDKAAEDALVSGGKGANSHLLECIQKGEAGFQFPETSVITTGAFESLVLADPNVQSAVSTLYGLPQFTAADARCQAIAEIVQGAIRAVKLPEDLIWQLSHELIAKRGDLAVRSSATCEDGQRHSAAGLGCTALHQMTVEDVAASVKEVWASLYRPEFITYRGRIGYPETQARMAVLLQRFVDARVAGVVNSFDQGTGRPGYCVSAQPGLGEGVVKAKGAVDQAAAGPFRLGAWIASHSGGSVECLRFRRHLLSARIRDATGHLLQLPKLPQAPQGRSRPCE